MRILLFGKNGQVGWELRRTLAPLGEVVAVDFPEVDFLDLKGLREFTLEAKPDLIVNAAAYTDVDKAESEPEIAMTINGKAPGVLGEAAKRLNAGLVHYSTDYVFDGTKGEPYTEEDETNPINEYGRSKLAGDLAIQNSGCAHLILRTSWVYGTRGKNFYLTILRLAKEQEEIRVVDDQVGCPTWCNDIAANTTNVLIKITENSKYLIAEALDQRGGLYNYSSSGYCSWFDFAFEIVKLVNSRSKVDCRIIPIKSTEIQMQAKRPKYSVLSKERIMTEFIVSTKYWDDQLKLCENSLQTVE